MILHLRRSHHERDTDPPEDVIAVAQIRAQTADLLRDISSKLDEISRNRTEGGVEQ